MVLNNHKARRRASPTADQPGHREENNMASESLVILAFGTGYGIVALIVIVVVVVVVVRVVL